MQVAVRMLRDAQPSFDISRLEQAVHDAQEAGVDDASIHSSHEKLKLLRALGVCPTPSQTTSLAYAVPCNTAVLICNRGQTRMKTTFIVKLHSLLSLIVHNNL